MSKFGLTEWEHDEIANTMETKMPPLEDRIDDALGHLKTELLKAMTKHAPMNSAHEGHSVIREELDELWDLVKTDMASTVEGRAEALQVAAMGLRFALDVCGDNPPTMQVQHARTYVPAPS